MWSLDLGKIWSAVTIASSEKISALPPEGVLRLKVHIAGVCHSDVHQVQARWILKTLFTLN